MSGLSKETKLMNVLIGLCIKTPKFEPVLFNNGYQLEKIEPHFTNENGEIINPDLQLKSHADKILTFVEIKCGSIEHEQAMRYKKLTKTEVVSQNVTSLDISNGDFEFLYICDGDTLNKVEKGDDEHQYGFTILCADNNELKSSRDRIKGATLKKIFSQKVTIPEQYPTEYYPYGPNDRKQYVAPSVFQSMLSLCGQGKFEMTAEEILKESHPMAEYIDAKTKGKIKAVINGILDDLQQDKFKDVLTKLKNPSRYRIHPKSLQSFQNLCQKTILEYSTQVQHKSLFEFENK